MLAYIDVWLSVVEADFIKSSILDDIITKD